MHKPKYALFIKICMLYSLTQTAIAGGFVQLSGHVPQQIQKSLDLGRLSSTSPLQMAISLNLKNQSGLTDTLNRIYNPSDPLFHHFLTPEQFTEAYAPSLTDLNQVTRYLTSQGFVVTKTHSNRLIIDVQGTSSQVEKTFQVEMHNYIAPDGSIAYSSTTEPSVPEEISATIQGIIGLNSFSKVKSHLKRNHSVIVGSAAGFNPSQIKTAYNLNSVSLDGTAQTIALFEGDVYAPSDIQTYATAYGLPTPNLQNILVDGGPVSQGAQDEVTLDIDMALLIAPNAKILVYQGLITSTGTVDIYNQIATDNLAQVVSTSWGLFEDDTTPSQLNSQNTIFQQMAAQGQSILAASGDTGAYNPFPTSHLAVGDPASQPYVTGVGGTSLTINSNYTYQSETSWNWEPFFADAGGGGISGYWGIPSWQVGLATSANLGSTTKRMVPDVSLNAVNGGYSIYLSGSWISVSGTSASAPLWAGFVALVNQQRAQVGGGMSPIGFLNPPLYQVAQGSSYSSIFHDIADHTTNRYYPAVAGFDLSTGWGSFNGANLIAALAAPAPPTINSFSCLTGCPVDFALTCNVSATGNNGLPLTYTWSTNPAPSYVIQKNPTNFQGHYSGTPSKVVVTVNITDGLTSTTSPAYGYSWPYSCYPPSGNGK